MIEDTKLLIIVMFIFTLVNYYLLLVILNRGFKRVAEAIEESRGAKKWINLE